MGGGRDLPFPELLGRAVSAAQQVLLLSAGADRALAVGEGISKCGEQPVLNLQSVWRSFGVRGAM